MAGYLTSYKDYYQGNYERFALQQAIAKAGGKPEHYELFKFLLTPSFDLTHKQDSSKLILHDNRAASSILFLFPPKIQIPLAILFYNEDKSINNFILPNFNLDYDSFIDIPTPYRIINNNCSVSQIPLGNTFLKVLEDSVSYNLSSYLDSQLKFILCIKNKEALFSNLDCTIRDKIDRVFDVIGLNHINKDKLKEIAASNNRLEAAVILSQALFYKPSCIQLIANVVEKWQIQNLNT